jgi:hypothetical protein
MSIDIYLAGPYSHPDPEVREARYDALTAMYARICRSGHVCYSPITQSHVAAVRHGLPTDAQYWSKVNQSFMLACRELWILDLDGWRESRGVRMEVRWAVASNMPIVLLPKNTTEIIRLGSVAPGVTPWLN